MALHNQLGKKGEQLAISYLVQKGYTILAHNWTCRKKEIDIVAQIDKTLIFIEVKTRTSTGFGWPEDFVTEAKQKHLRNAAEEYIYQNDFKGEIRFDIIAILFNKQEEFEMRHIEDAFW